MTSTVTSPATHPILAPGAATDARFEHVREMFAADRASQALGMTITHLDLEEVRGHFTVTEEMCNGHGTAQGGVLTTFADALFAGACNAPGDIAVAAQLSMHFVSPARVGDVVEGHATTRAAWGRNGITDVALTCNGKLVAEFRGTSRTVRSA